MTTLTIQEAQAQLEEIIHWLAPGDEVVITENNQPVARLVPTAPQVAPPKNSSLGHVAGNCLVHGTIR